MSIGDRLFQGHRSGFFWLVVAVLASVSSGHVRADSSFVASEQSGIAFPAVKIAGAGLAASTL